VIYVCIPARDEERTIGLLLWKVRKTLLDFGRDFEVLVLDDGSTDRTAEVLARYSAFLPMRVIREREHLGYGGAVERLLREVVARSAYPKRDVAVTLQADFTEDPADLVGMVKRIEGGADLVAGSLVPSLGALPRAYRMSRRLARLLLGRAHRKAPVSDPLSGFRAYRVIVLKKAFREGDPGERIRNATGWGANLQILSLAAPHARRIDEAPFSPVFIRRERPSRFRPFSALHGLFDLRKTSWPPPQLTSDGEPAA
jgi:dolichol-phosphate mannosyltransferase